MYLSNGNKKVLLPTFCLPAGRTCPNKTPACGAGGCYAIWSEKRYPKVKASRARNYTESLGAGFVLNAIDYLENHKKAQKTGRVRWHESGDFYNYDYFRKVCAIAGAVPDIHFLAYTKSTCIDPDEAPPNLTLLGSVMVDTKPEDLIEGLKRAYTGPCVPAGLNLFECKDGLQCGPCTVCWDIYNLNYDGVHFTPHGSGAKKLLGV